MAKVRALGTLPSNIELNPMYVFEDSKIKFMIEFCNGNEKVKKVCSKICR